MVNLPLIKKSPDRQISNFHIVIITKATYSDNLKRLHDVDLQHLTKKRFEKFCKVLENSTIKKKEKVFLKSFLQTAPN